MILKILWQRFALMEGPDGRDIEPEQDRHEVLLPVERVDLYGVDDGGAPNMAAWDLAQYEVLVSYIGGENDKDPIWKPSRLISATVNGQQKWFVVSKAWLCDDRGDTIQRLVP